MSRLFLATEASLHRQVVIKLLPPELASEVSEARFKQEIELAARLQHPNILPVLTAGAKDELLFYVMPFVTGESLRHRLTREGRLPVTDAVRILHEIADALAFAHAEGVIHRDIKPENILLEGSHAVLTDFGVARALAEARSGGRLTEAGISVGTPAYMSPEQAAGERHIDASADVYALAVVGYEMLAGMPPFKGPTAQALIAAQITAAPPPLAAVRPETPPEIEDAIIRALAKDPNARLRTAAEFRDAIGARSVATVAGSRGRRLAVLGGVAVLFVLAGYGVLAGLRGRRQMTSASPQEMLVVLPFVNLGSSEDEYFADGITEELTARLAAIHGFGVISRTSAVHYRKTDKPLKQIGQELGVTYVLEGTIRTERASGRAHRVRVTPQLIRVSDDTHLWAEIYDEALADVFQVQSSIASRVAAALNVALLEPERRVLESKPTANLEAYGYYLRGNEYLNRSYQVEGSVRPAIAMYEKATSLDSTFALAYAKLSFAHNGLFWFGFDPSPERLAASKRAADRALELQGDLPEGHVALGYYYYHGQLDYDRALEQFALAQRGRPSNSEVLAAIGFVQRRQGKWEQAVTSLVKAIQLDPRSNDYAEELGETYLAMRDYPNAERWFDRAQALAPDWALIYAWKAWLYLLWKGDVGRAQRVFSEASRDVSTEELLAAAARISWGKVVTLFDQDYRKKVAGLSLASFGTDTAAFHRSKAQVNALMNQPRVARAHFDSARVVLEGRVRRRPDDPFAHVGLSRVYASLGRKADAIREGTEAVAVLPSSKDAYVGPWMVENLAEIYVMGSVVGTPGGITVPLLQRDPIWAPLRGNPEYEKLLQAKR